MTAVAVRGLSVRFGQTVALDRVDLRVEPGEMMLLLGPSGCGKTTLLRAIAGFVTPEQGAILLGDEDVTRLAPHRRDTGMVFQAFALWPHLDVGENVAFGLRERKVSARDIDRRVTEALEAVRMGQHVRRRVDQLSGGEQQRVALARALVVRPRCLLLDEPLSNLDAGLRHSMRAEIRRVCKEFQLTAVYVTHDQKEALAVADRISVMKNGRILQVGTPLEVYRAPASRTVATFLGETNLLDATVVAVDAEGIRLRTALGELTAAPGLAPAVAAGDKVWVSLRPECFALSGSDLAAARNRIDCAIESTTYLGDIAEHTLRCGSERLRTSELNPRAATRAAGTSAPSSASANIVATIAPEDVVVLPFDELERSA